MITEKAQLLLDQAGGLVREAKAKLAASGELFNLFTITRIERAEVNTHSAMIAELLNPEGRHGQGVHFLELFLSTMGFEHECSLIEARVKKEQAFAGYGRVDVVIHLRDHLILLENKIDAPDGNRQLKRYDDIGKASGKKWQLWYLTKKGTDAHASSHRDVSYRRLSYQEHILDWLEQCVTSSSETLALQHALIQYKNLVQKITGRTMTHTTRNALIDLLTAGDNLQAAEAIAQALPHAKGVVLFGFFQAVQRALSESHAPAPSPIGFTGHDSSEVNCSKWFMPKPLRLKNVGQFFDIGVEGMLLRIEVATDALHYGVVAVIEGKLASDEMLRAPIPQLPLHLMRRDWKAFNWYSCLYRDNVSSKMDCLSDPGALVTQVLRTIELIKSGMASQR
ncbi:PD-(D/E)XK nuclease family protein [Pseudomonas shahriarae]|uniref:PD-(D/E)XK nuclease family protein n=1 Tax=Pseudomonas shahriarae TaxID=2745512 RepID=A0ABT5N9P4_9PSED|nr:PD-(D/E)XK nuclease family protein [Pseudomonas shahriarae]MDD0984039.1 PD-(D/E)XK nuclease family protein [Pseudomonas shahriarae]MDD1036229.1 PD-(D/E)XK nuclease family protein [Pseudomonas shahriarae]